MLGNPTDCNDPKAYIAKTFIPLVIKNHNPTKTLNISNITDVSEVGILNPNPPPD